MIPSMPNPPPEAVREVLEGVAAGALSVDAAVMALTETAEVGDPLRVPNPAGNFLLWCNPSEGAEVKTRGPVAASASVLTLVRANTSDEFLQFHLDRALEALDLALERVDRLDPPEGF